MSRALTLQSCLEAFCSFLAPEACLRPFCLGSSWLFVGVGERAESDVFHVEAMACKACLRSDVSRC